MLGERAPQGPHMHACVLVWDCNSGLHGLIEESLGLQRDYHKGWWDGWGWGGDSAHLFDDVLHHKALNFQLER